MANANGNQAPLTSHQAAGFQLWRPQNLDPGRPQPFLPRGDVTDQQYSSPHNRSAHRHECMINMSAERTLRTAVWGEPAASRHRRYGQRQAAA